MLGTIPHVEALQRQISGAPFKYKQLDKDGKINLLLVAHLLHITLKMVVLSIILPRTEHLTVIISQYEVLLCCHVFVHQCQAGSRTY